MSSIADASLASLTKALNTVLEKLGFQPSSGAIGGLAPTMRTLLSGAALAILLQLYFGKRRKRSRYVNDLRKVGKQVVDGQAPELPEYDVIVVGGGTSGCALAARLSENPSIRILLLEAGGSGQALPESRTPASYTRLYAAKEHVHNFWTELQSSADGTKKFWPRARMLGGCSSINAQMAQYGAAGDFDEWASVIGDESWAWKNFAQYFRKFESFQPHPDYPLVDASARGSTGPVHVGYYNTITDWCNYFIRSCVNTGIPFTHDFSGAIGTMGVGRVMTYINSKYERVSSESAYLTPDVLARPNLTVVINATVTRVLLDKTGTGLRAVGVEFANEEDGPRFQAKANKEVIVSAGTVQSPHVLMLSGIGPAAHLESKGVPAILDLPGIGTQLVDHPIVDMYFKQKGSIGDVKFFKPKSLGDAFKLARAIAQYYILRTGGPLAMNFGEVAAFVRTDDPVLFPPSEFPEKLVDSTSAKDSPDLEFFSTPIAYKNHGRTLFDVNTFSIHVYLLRPTSRGAVLLNSANPFAHPSVNPNYIATHDDLAKLVRGVRLGLRIAQQEPLNSLLDHACTRPDLDHFLHLKSNAELEDLVRQRVETVYHPTSSCRMAPKELGGVVDGKLRVYGVEGLRVCDASVFPSIISGHTAGACFATAEKLADDIKAEF